MDKPPFWEMITWRQQQSQWNATLKATMKFHIVLPLRSVLIAMRLLDFSETMKQWRRLFSPLSSSQWMCRKSIACTKKLYESWFELSLVGFRLFSIFVGSQNHHGEKYLLRYINALWTIGRSLGSRIVSNLKELGRRILEYVKYEKEITVTLFGIIVHESGFNSN